MLAYPPYHVPFPSPQRQHITADFLPTLHHQTNSGRKSVLPGLNPPPIQLPLSLCLLQPYHILYDLLHSTEFSLYGYQTQSYSPVPLYEGIFTPVFQSNPSPATHLCRSTRSLSVLVFSISLHIPPTGIFHIFPFFKATHTSTLLSLLHQSAC